MGMLFFPTPHIDMVRLPFFSSFQAASAFWDEEGSAVIPVGRLTRGRSAFDLRFFFSLSVALQEKRSFRIYLV